jgi:hypothetical protein
LLVVLGACGGREVVVPAEPDAKIMCPNCLDGSVYAVGTKLQFMTSWVGKCTDGRWHIGLEGGSAPEPCNEQHYTISLKCSPACEVDSATDSVTLPKPGQYSIDVIFKRSGHFNKSVNLAVLAMAPAKAAMTCRVSQKPGESLVDLSVLSSTGAHLAATLTDMTVGGAPCTIAEYGSEYTRFACPVGGPRIEVAVRAASLSATQTLDCY